MIAKEMMKRGGILSRLAQFKEESPYKPDHRVRTLFYAEKNGLVQESINGLSVYFSSVSAM